MEQIKPRYELKNARLLAGLNEAELADKIGVDEETVRRWETGIQTPHAWAVGRLCKLFNVDHPRKLNLDAQFTTSTRCGEDEVIEMLKGYGRRELLAILAKLPAFAGVDLTVLFSTTVVAPERYLSVCEAIVKGCWNLLGRNGKDLADGLLSACLPQLENLATHLSKYQHQAASLVVEAKIMQMIIAKHKMKFVRCETLGSDAVRFGAMSKDPNLHALALSWHGDTYKSQYCQPDLAIVNYTDALKCDDISLLNKADICMGMAKAYALSGNEKLARDFAEKAHIAIPDNPESDPLYHCIRLGQSELDMIEGNMYLVLAKLFPAKKEYAQMAYDAFVKSTSRRSFDIGYRSQMLLNRADAARGIGEMRYYLDCLEQGAHIALQIGSENFIALAVTILQKALVKWRNEQQYIELRKLLTPNSVIH